MQIDTAMILAAGEGRRMRPLTLTTPKPLLEVAGIPLIVHHINKLAALGVHRIIINLAYLGEKIEAALGDGTRYGVTLLYSYEPSPLETAGALAHALPLLGKSPFILVNGDIYTDFDFGLLNNLSLDEQCAGCLVLVPNPEHNPSGDFAIDEQGRVAEKGACPLAGTFSGISVLRPELVATYPKLRACFPLKEVFDFAIQSKALSAFVYDGFWTDVGTPQRLQQVNARVCK